MKKLVRSLAAAVAALALWVGFLSCSDGGGSSDNHITVKFPNKATITALSAAETDEEAAAVSVKYESISINIGSNASATLDTITAKVKTNSKAKEVLDLIIADEVASSEDIESLTYDDLTYAYFDGEYLDVTTEDGRKAGVNSVTADVAKGKTVYLFAYYDDENEEEDDDEPTPSEDGVTVAWDFGSNDLWKAYSDEALTTEISNKIIQSTTGYVTGSRSFAPIYVNAESGKFATNAANLQFVAGTEIWIPVSTGSVVTLSLYPTLKYTGTFTFGGNEIGCDADATECDTLVTSLTAKTAGYVKLIAKTNGYLQSIVVTSLVDGDDFSEKAETGDLVVVGETTEAALFVQLTGDDAVTNAASGTLKAYIAGTPSITGTTTETDSSTGEEKTVNVYAPVKWTVSEGSDFVSIVDSDGNAITESKASQGNKGYSSSVTVKFKAAGSAKITASIDGVTSESFTVTASEVPVTAELTGDAVAGVKDTDISGVATIAVTNDTFSSAVQALEAGASAADYITLTPSADSVTVSAITVKTVSASSLIVNYTLKGTAAVSSGTISATLKAGALSYTAAAKDATGTIGLTLTEGKVAVTSVAFTADGTADGTAFTAKKVVIGGTIDLSKYLVVLPEDATDKTVTWSGTGVDTNGLVTVSAAVAVEITATSSDDDTKSATFTVTGVANSVQEYNFFAATDLTVKETEVTSIGSDTTSKATVTGIYYDSSNKACGSSASQGGTVVLPVSGADTTVILYVTQAKAEITATLSDGTFSVAQTVKGRGINDGSPSASNELKLYGRGAQAFAWRYTGGKTSVTLTIGNEGFISIAKIVTTNASIPTEVTTSAFDFTKSSAYNSDTDGTTSYVSYTQGATGLTTELYCLNAAATESYYTPFFVSTEGITTYGAHANVGAWFTFAVGGACNIAVDISYANAATTLYVFDAAGNQLDCSVTSNGTQKGSLVANYTGDAGILTIGVGGNVYFKTITISPAE